MFDLTMQLCRSTLRRLLGRVPEEWSSIKWVISHFWCCFVIQSADDDVSSRLAYVICHVSLMLIWVFWMTLVAFTHWKLACVIFSCPIPLDYVILDRSSFVVNLLLCCAYPFRIRTYLYLSHTLESCDFDLVIFCCDSSWTVLLLWIYGFVFSIPLFIFTI